MKTRRPTLLSLMRKAFNLLRREGDAQMPNSAFDYGHAVGDGMSSAVIMAPALWIARQFPEAPIAVKDPQGELHLDHPLAQLIHSPNPWYGGGTMKMALGADYATTGNAYMEMERLGNGMPVKLFYQPSFQITPKGTDTELITHFIHDTSKGQRRIEREDMVHFRLGLDPHNQRVGISPLTILLREIYTDDQAATMTAAILRNLGVPGVIISPANPEDDKIGPTMRDEIKTYFRRMFRGDNAGDVMVLQDDIKLTTLDIDLAKINIDKLRQIPEERVTAVMGIPAAVVGFGSGLEQTKVGATMKELREQAYENAIIPMQSVFSEELDRALLPEFETRTGFTVVFDNSNVRVLQEDQNRKSDRHMKEWLGGGILRSELRAELGRESTPADDVYRQGFSDIMVPAGHVASDPVEPDGEKTADWIAKAFKGPAEDLARLQRRFIDDAQRLSRVWADELQREFETLGRELAALWLAADNTLASRNGDTKAIPPDADRRIVDQLLLDFDASGPDYGVAYLRVLRTTHASIESVMNLGVNLDDPIERFIVAQGGTRKGLIDFTEQARTSMYDVIAQGRADGIGPQEMARILRERIPAGPRWSSAEVRAEIIARTETKFAQNVSSLRIYKAADNVTQVIAFDAQLGETDADCEARAGQPFSIEEAESIIEHPNGTLSWGPVVGERMGA